MRIPVVSFAMLGYGMLELCIVLGIWVWSLGLGGGCVMGLGLVLDCGGGWEGKGRVRWIGGGKGAGGYVMDGYECVGRGVKKRTVTRVDA